MSTWGSSPAERLQRLDQRVCFPVPKLSEIVEFTASFLLSRREGKKKEMKSFVVEE